jgi:hypothetical protein
VQKRLARVEISIVPNFKFKFTKMTTIEVGDARMVSFKQTGNLYGSGTVPISAIHSSGKDLELSGHTHKYFVVIGELHSNLPYHSLRESLLVLEEREELKGKLRWQINQGPSTMITINLSDSLLPGEAEVAHSRFNECAARYLGEGLGIDLGISKQRKKRLPKVSVIFRPLLL